MCEKKNKKLLVSLFLIPIFSLTALFSHTAPTYAAVPLDGGGPGCDTPTAVYYFNNSKSTVTSEIVGYNDDGTKCDATNKVTYTRGTVGNSYVGGGTDANCKDTITISGATTGANAAAQGQLVNYKITNGICVRDGDPNTINVAATQAAAVAAVPDPTEAGQAGADGKTSCAIQGIGWLLCPVMNFTAGIADTALSFISDSFLSVNTQLYDTNSGTYSAWQGILGFANIIFVIIFLIIIFAQATGVGISNYGIKKMLPKLIIGVILINISYFICQAAVDISNITGYGFNKFFDNITTNVVTTGAPQADGDTNGLNTSSWQYLTGIVITAGAGVGLAYLLGLSVLIPILFVVVVTLLFIFLILILRQALIVVLIIVAPLAFAAWLLPNTEKFFKQWWGLFSKLLLLFPIISIVFGASKLASAILRDAYTNINPVSGAGSENVATNNSELIGQIIAAGILVIPLIAVPLILKGALNAVPVLGNMMQKAYNNNTGKARQMGANSGLAQYDKQRKANRNARVASGNYRGAGGIINPFNLGSAANRRLNKSGAFNAATFGYGAQRDLAAQRQSEKDRKEAVDMFNNNEGLMQAWSKSRGSKNSAEYKNLDPTSRRQFDRMVAVGHARKSTSFLAVADYMSQNGKGDFDTYRNAMVAAKATGADQAELSDTEAGSSAAYRGSGRGDIVGQINAHIKRNGKVSEGGSGIYGTKTIYNRDGTIDQTLLEQQLTSMEKGWSEVSAAKVHREGIKVDRNADGSVLVNPSTGLAMPPVPERGEALDLGMLSYQRFLTGTNVKKSTDGRIITLDNGKSMPGDGQNISAALEKYGDMEQRAQNQVKDTLIASAEDFRKRRLEYAQDEVKAGRMQPDQIEDKFKNRITNINQAKDMFGQLPGGRGGGIGNLGNTAYDSSGRATGGPTPPGARPSGPTPTGDEVPDTIVPDIDASDDSYDDAAD